MLHLLFFLIFVNAFNLRATLDATENSVVQMFIYCTQKIIKKANDNNKLLRLIIRVAVFITQRYG